MPIIQIIKDNKGKSPGLSRRYFLNILGFFFKKKKNEIKKKAGDAWGCCAGIH
jgi:hypothetical protein